MPNKEREKIGRSIRLSGENLAADHERVAQKFTKEISRFPEVEGVVLLGGASRGFADKHSDIDIVVFINKKNFKEIPRGERIYEGFDLDTIVLYLPSAKREDWSQEQRWAYLSAKILYDPGGKIEKLLREKVIFSEEEQREILVENIFFLAWYGINPEEGEWQGFQFTRKPDFWIDRGDIISAHYILNRSLDMAVDILYLANQQLIPDEKWKFNLVFGLPWLPPGLEKKLREATLVKGMTKRDFKRRLKAIREIYKETLNKIKEEERLLPSNIYAYLLEHSPYYKVS